MKKTYTNEDVTKLTTQVNEMFAGVILSLENNEISVVSNEKLIWFSINNTLDEGTGIMMYISIKDGIKKAIVKLNKGAVSKLHFHENMIEKFRVLDGRLSYKLYYSNNEKNVKDFGVLEEGCEISIDGGIWHRVFTTLEDTFLEATFVNN